ncbi:ras-like GTP-binding protein RhoL [Ischnura elegans]|uniref:ras-like GTP-binding protein RhoL n=1 Tax=Ischnura elegans TaxID=197161 RepID=UPI001ED8808A|nr:ras-like GTP-binding protein RhoL [Ischnura elegans]XP_046393540.1 ras-like GTP-binding protein RhoL [Ischnura elegans]
MGGQNNGTTGDQGGGGRLRPIKITAVGDGMVGKTCLLITYTTKKFPTEYVPTVFDNFADNITVDGQEINMILWDTAGQEDYERLRPLSYPNTNCFLLCFSISNRSSFENIVTKWTPEIKHHCPDVPIILVATKTDLRQNPGNDDDPKKPAVEDLIQNSEGKKLRQRIKAAGYVECSAKNGDGLQEVFETAVRCVLKRPPSSRKPLCCIL